MSAYFVLNYDITDAVAFNEYNELIGPVLKPYLDSNLAEILVVDRNFTEKLVEGSAGSSLVIVKFKDRETLTKFYHSPAYQGVIHYRTDNSVGWAAIV